MENQEQKSQSEITDLSPVIQPMSQPHRAIIPFPREEIRKEMDKYWEEHKDAIIDKYKIKGRKSKGGVMKNAQAIAENNIGFRKLYYPVFVAKISEKVDDVLFVEDVEGRLDEENDEIFNVFGKFYYFPKYEIEQPPSFSVVKSFNDNVEEMYEERLKDLQRKYRVVAPYEGSDIKEDHQVLVDIVASCDDAPYEPWSLHNKIVPVNYFREDVKKDILLHKKDDLFEASYVMDDKDPDFEGKTINLVIKIRYSMNLYKYFPKRWG